MVNHKHKFLYLHLPKTGGTSINKFFNDRFNDNEFDFGHPYLSDYGNKISHYFKFTIVRNPYDRLVSAFFYMSKYSKFQSDINFRKHWKLKDDTFESFVIQKLPKIVDDPKIRPRHFKPQVDFGTAGLNYVGSFNTIQKDIDYVCDELNIKRRNLPHANKSNHKEYQKYYTKELLDIVHNLYFEDFNNYDHLF